VAAISRRIGLSLGADLCWPACFEEIVKRLDLEVPVGRDRVRFEVERITIEPFDLRQPCRYDVVLDRLTHWLMISREWMKKIVVMDDVYVLNNPWAIQADEKHTTYCAMMRLGFPVPATWMVPQKSYEPNPDLEVTLRRYAKLFDLGEVGRKVGYPLFMKPYDGGAWVGVTKIADEAAMRAAYEKSGKRLMHVQKAVSPSDLFVRGLGVGPQVAVFRYDADAPLHARYTTDVGFLSAPDEALVRDMTLTINAFFGWDFNSCEALRKDGVFHPIDFANACPDSQVTSLHYHFPWLVKAKVRWALFVAATKKKMGKTLDWDPFFEIAADSGTFREKLAAYAAIARERLEADRFAEFSATHLSRLDEVAWEFFGSDVARQAVRAKVAALFPPHEIEEFTEYFWRKIQDWRRANPAPSRP
jgi:hypothetical protein